MRHLTDICKRPWVRCTAAAATAAALLVYIALVLAAGGQLLQFAAVIAAAVFSVLLPGLFWHRLLRLESFVPGFRFPLSVVLGIGSLAVSYRLGMWLGLLWLFRLLPLMLSAAFVLSVWQKKPRMREVRQQLAGFWQQNWPLFILTAALIFVYGWCGVTKYAHPTAAGQLLLNQDHLWNIGNAQSFLIAFPPQDIRFYNVRLTYHYLTEMLAACLCLQSGVSCYDILSFYQQPLMLCALVAGLYRFGLFYFEKAGSSRRPRALLFTFSLFVFGCASLWKILPNGMSVFWNSSLTHLITNINAQTTATLILCVFSALFLQAARQRFCIGVFPFAVLLACFVLLCFAKGPLAAIVACAAVLTILFLLAERRAGWQGLLLGGCLAGLFVLIYFSMYAFGANNSMKLTFYGTLEKSYFGNILRLLQQTNPRLYALSPLLLIPLQSLLTLPAALPLFVYGALGDLKRLFSLEGDALFPSAAAVGGLLAFFLFNHPSMSQVYFLLLAIVFINLLAVRALPFSRPLPAAGRLKKLVRRVWTCGVALLAAVGLCTAGFNYVNLCGSGLRQLLFNYDILEKYPYDCVMTADDEAAANWLRANTDAHSCMFATNRIHTGGRREGISNLYSALSGRQAFMEGFQYAVTNMGVSTPVVKERLAAQAVLFDAASTPQQILDICRQYGITHILFSRQMDGSESQLTAFPCVYSGPDVRIYAVLSAETVPEGPAA